MSEASFMARVHKCGAASICISVPRAVREVLELKPGDYVEVRVRKVR